jgi:hypothetical protein
MRATLAVKTTLTPFSLLVREVDDQTSAFNRPLYPAQVFVGAR